MGLTNSADRCNFATEGVGGYVLVVRHARHLPFLSQPSRPFAKRRHARVTAQIFWLKNRDPAHWPMPGRWSRCSAGTSFRTAD